MILHFLIIFNIIFLIVYLSLIVQIFVHEKEKVSKDYKKCAKAKKNRKFMLVLQILLDETGPTIIGSKQKRRNAKSFTKL